MRRSLNSGTFSVLMVRVIVIVSNTPEDTPSVGSETLGTSSFVSRFCRKSLSYISDHGSLLSYRKNCYWLLLNQPVISLTLRFTGIKKRIRQEGLHFDRSHHGLCLRVRGVRFTEGIPSRSLHKPEIVFVPRHLGVSYRILFPAEVRR